MHGDLHAVEWLARSWTHLDDDDEVKGRAGLITFSTSIE
jgi:hypothetical protein